MVRKNLHNGIKTPHHYQVPQNLEKSSKSLDQIIKSNGYNHGKLFHSHDKATYTFVYDNEVISLHFNVQKQDLYLKGHKITNLEVHPLLNDFLLRFKKALMEDAETKHFIPLFDTTVNRLRHI